MKCKDEKTHIVTEALHGIRQIKFSAIESLWEEKILTARKAELDALYGLFYMGILLTVNWFATPTLIGAAALSVYAWLSGHMVASVAFTALSVFSSLEWTIGVIPSTTTELFDALVSARRIQEHLNQPDRPQVLGRGDLIEFKDATIAWPSQDASRKGFALRDLNLCFPTGKLR